MVQMLAGFQLSQALYVVAKLGVPDLLVEGPRPADTLAEAAGADAGCLRRILRTLASIGLFEETPDDGYALTPLGRTLATDDPGSVRDLAITWMETHYAPFGDLLHTVRTGESAATHFYGQPFFTWLASDPEKVERFTAAMGNLTSGIKVGALPNVDIRGSTVVDVGGGDGTVLAHLLGRYPDVRGVVLDLPHVVGAVQKVAAEFGVTQRLDAVGGDFFEAVPAGDTYLLSMVIHDWADEDAVRILQRVRAAGSPGAQLRIMDFVVPPGSEPHMSKMIDLTMMGMLTGRERVADEWRDLLDRAGWRVDRIVATPTPISVIEASALEV
jgi:hypothetical protein